MLKIKTEIPLQKWVDFYSKWPERYNVILEGNEVLVIEKNGKIALSVINDNPLPFIKENL